MLFIRAITWALLAKVAFLGPSVLVAQGPTPAPRPNVLLIAIDDLNDWIGCLGGHPQAQTPHIDRLAEQGMLFSNAHCQSPVCNPSRVSLMSGLYPETTGIYFLRPSFSASPVSATSTTMPVRFQAAGYRVTAAGKLFHSKENEQYFAYYAGSFGDYGPYPEQKLASLNRGDFWDLGAYPANDQDLTDYQIAAWPTDQLTGASAEPFFLGVGFYRPHVPQYAPQRWFDLYRGEPLQLPAVRRDDLDDVPLYGQALTRRRSALTHDWVLANDEWEPLVLSYLACVSFVDDQGKVLDALEASPAGANTFVVLFSDHGFHLGEKAHWAKRTLWEESTRYRFIRYNDGSEEFYDHAHDPHEWHNRIADAERGPITDQHRSFYPATFHPPLGHSSPGHQSYHTAETLNVGHP